ncbi:hypothetical protein CFC35_41630 [Streptomyces sp. FBKL.4005]|uniref:hypothetical protein n=1 Tax=Streptomyces sp. FBKL.4005 TaxID=2015515 RepID=UPI000B979C0D|nr:hypothetical protein [Streptomyces sp. FBKL.4005]OYP10134.1 hypothetical protein CFC35_41585 [Streptomyces sp. FBKL.4005]OYP10143.1 hypothetical protein CFC35_41630 [Streptomyces sp. FBKL.4005]
MSTRRRPVVHDEECEAGLFEGGVCICAAGDVGDRYDAYDCPVYGEEPSSYDGRLSGPSLDW